MLNVHDLERRWFTYKIKRTMPYVLSTLGIIGIAVGIIIYLPEFTTKQKSDPIVLNVETKTKDKNLTTEIKKDSINVMLSETAISVPQNTQIEIESKKEPTLVLKPSLQFMDNIEDTISTYIEEDYQQPQSLPLHETALTYQADETISQPPIQVSQEEKKRLSLSVTTQKSDADLKDVIRRFKKNKNPTLSLFIAKHYYNEGNYQKSYNYALMTNEIDKTIDESWIIFSKSLVKLGQSELAVNTLKSYLKTTKSSTAEVLLQKIESGSFK